MRKTFIIALLFVGISCFSTTVFASGSTSVQSERRVSLVQDRVQDISGIAAARKTRKARRRVKTSGSSLPKSAEFSSLCKKVKKVYGGFLWKPSSDHSGKPREGKPLIAVTKSAPSLGCLGVYAKDGTTAQKVSTLGVYTRGGKYGYRAYAGWGCGDGKDGKQMVRAAKKASGSSRIYLKVDPGVCVGPIVPTKRKGSL